MSIYTINKKTYTKKRYVQEYETLQLQKPEIAIFDKYRSEIEGKKILDIGCGTGRTTMHLRNYSPFCIGIDYSEEMIAQCREKFGDNRFEEGDVRDLRKFADDSMDFVLFSFNGLGHLCHADRIGALREINRVLKPGQYFVFSSHNRDYFEQTWNGKSPVPKLKMSRRPRRMAENARRYLRSYYNYLKNRRFEKIEDDYAIIVGIGHDHGLLTYWINMKAQIAQLEATGFETIEVYDLEGLSVQQDTEVRDNAWLYYVVRKRQPTVPSNN